MADNPFCDRAAPPAPAAVAEALGRTAAYLEDLAGHPPVPLAREWKFYGASAGWTLKLLEGKRNLCFVSVRRGRFMVTFVFGDAAVRRVEQSDLPADLIRELVEARRYAEGRGLRLEVKTRRALGHAKTLLDIKRAG